LQNARVLGKASKLVQTMHAEKKNEKTQRTQGKRAWRDKNETISL